MEGCSLISYVVTVDVNERSQMNSIINGTQYPRHITGLAWKDDRYRSEEDNRRFTEKIREFAEKNIHLNTVGEYIKDIQWGQIPLID